ncbi:MAG: molybdopterin-guanine dinucleotide biosynthesis protein B [Acidimicrobiales bacterium]
MAASPHSSDRAGLPPMVSFVAPSGTGKTTMVTDVIGRLTDAGHRVAAIKHDAHRIELDTVGKDSWKMRQAGAETLLVGANQVAWMSDAGTAPPLEDLVRLFFAEAELVIVEGWRSAELPTIIVDRPEARDGSWERPHHDRILATLHPDEVDRAVALVLAQLDASTGSTR